VTGTDTDTTGNAAPAPSLASAPRPGELCRIRRRLWLVNGAEPSHAAGVQNTLLSMVSVEDDSLGEELRAIWELEPGAEIVEASSLPRAEAFDTPEAFQAFLNALRWGAASLADQRTLLAPYRSGIQIEDYQLDPVTRAVQMPRANLLIADDVGLGKTIETGLVIQEFLSRHRARSVLIVVPATLQLKWRDEMRDKFGLEFKIVNTETLKELRRKRGIHVNPWTHFPRLITSIDYLKRQRPLQMLREALPTDGIPRYPRTFDILVVDEAHMCAPSGTGKFALDSVRTQVIREIVPHFEHRLFLSATPHNGYPESFTALLELIDNQRFAVGVEPDRKSLEQIMVRRLKAELATRTDGTVRFAKRVLHHLEVEYEEDESKVHSTLKQYGEILKAATREHSRSLASEFVLKLLKKRLFSSPAAFLHTIEKHRQTLEGKVRTVHRNNFAEAEDADFERDEEADEAADTLMVDASAALTLAYNEVKPLLFEMKAWGEKYSGRPDSKTRSLLTWLNEHIRPNSAFGSRRVIIFTEYRDTQKWLSTILTAQGYAEGGRLELLYGGMDEQERERIKAAFQADPSQAPVRILLATDTASEGIDLQNHCYDLIHFEIPWNPNRLEQRNGRIDRHGQRATEANIYHFVAKGFEQNAPTQRQKPGTVEGDLEFLYRAALKLQNISRDLLGKVAPVLAEQVEQAMLGKMTTLDLSRVERETEVITRQMKVERDIQKQIAAIHQRLLETKTTLNVTPENVKAVVDLALSIANQPPLKQTSLKRNQKSDQGGSNSKLVFTMPKLHDSWSRCLEGLAHPHTGEIRPITFDHSVAEGRDDVVLVHLNHPLAQMSARLLRAEVWSQRDRRALNRAAVFGTTHVKGGAALAIAFARLIIVGGDGARLHEEIIPAGVELTAKGSSRRVDTLARLHECISSGQSINLSSERSRDLLSLQDELEEKLLSGLNARMEERSKSLESTFASRAKEEESSMRKVLEELRTGITLELKQETPAQLSLFEEQQVNRNRTALEQRLARIPEEIEREIGQIQRRFANCSARLFPVAIAFYLSAAEASN
jgi:ERCC4-related helicase